MSVNDNQFQSMIINDSTIFFGGFPNYLYLPESFFLFRWCFSPWFRDCGKPWRRKRANGDKIEKMAEDRLMILRSHHLFSSFGQETNGQPFYKCDNTFLPKISACQHLHISCSLVSQRIHFHKINILTAPQYCHLQKLLCQIKISRWCDDTLESVLIRPAVYIS